jgi:hypothetical protein
MRVTGRGRRLNLLTIFINATDNTDGNAQLGGQQIVLRYSCSSRFVVSVTIMFSHQSCVIMTFGEVLSIDLTKGNADYTSWNTRVMLQWMDFTRYCALSTLLRNAEYIYYLSQRQPASPSFSRWISVSINFPIYIDPYLVFRFVDLSVFF